MTDGRPPDRHGDAWQAYHDLRDGLEDGLEDELDIWSDHTICLQAVCCTMSCREANNHETRMGRTAWDYRQTKSRIRSLLQAICAVGHGKAPFGTTSPLTDGFSELSGHPAV